MANRCLWWVNIVFVLWERWRGALMAFEVAFTDGIGCIGDRERRRMYLYTYR